MPDKNTPDDNKPEEKPRRFISEKIVKQPMSRRDMLRRAAALLLTSAVFGVVAAVTFVASRPVAERYLIKETTKEIIPVTIPKDEPDTTVQIPETSPSETPETEPIEDVLKSAIEKYPFSVEDLNTLYSSLRTVAQKADKGIVTVHSVKTQTDWFNNPVETSGLFAGAIIASTSDEYLVLTPEAAIEEADAIRVAFSDGTEVQGTIKQTDALSGMAIVSVPTAELGRALLEEVKAIELGNSYSVKAGDMLIAIGGPAGMVHSVGYGFVSYVARNVQITDGMTRLLYADLESNAQTGTFLLNMSGQIVGWVTDSYKNEANSQLTIAMAISDYKSILERMSNAVPYPYFGIQGQEVTAVMNSAGMPLGVYVVTVQQDSPAYEAGIQCGDIITGMGEAGIITMKDFQVKLESLSAGEAVGVLVLRNGRDEYKEIAYQVTIRAR